MDDQIASPDTTDMPRSERTHVPTLTDHATLLDLAMRMAMQLWSAKRLAVQHIADPAAPAAPRRTREID